MACRAHTKKDPFLSRVMRTPSAPQTHAQDLHCSSASEWLSCMTLLLGQTLAAGHDGMSVASRRTLFLESAKQISSLSRRASEHFWSANACNASACEVIEHECEAFAARACCRRRWCRRKCARSGACFLIYSLIHASGVSTHAVLASLHWCLVRIALPRQNDLLCCLCGSA